MMYIYKYPKKPSKRIKSVTVQLPQMISADQKPYMPPKIISIYGKAIRRILDNHKTIPRITFPPIMGVVPDPDENLISPSTC